MKSKMQRHVFLCLLILCCQLSFCLCAQTEHDGIMMNKNQWCNGATYMHSQWANYWEGTFKRSNANLGTVTAQTIMYMTNYGITDNLNILGTLPYTWTSASKGTLHGMKGLQDASLYVKWRPLTFRSGAKRLSLFAVGGISTPASDYNIELMPLSIGMGATNISGRVTADLQSGSFFATASAAYVRRSNVKLDRTSYYTTEIHLTDEVKMPDLAMFNFSVGIRKKFLVAEAIVSNGTTLGGFDIRKNDMPFPSNKMNSTTAGIHAKYTLPFFTHIELIGDGNYVIAGRNVGQATTFAAGVYYILTFHHPKSSK